MMLPEIERPDGQADADYAPLPAIDELPPGAEPFSDAASRWPSDIGQPPAFSATPRQPS